MTIWVKAIAMVALGFSLGSAESLASPLVSSQANTAGVVAMIEPLDALVNELLLSNPDLQAARAAVHAARAKAGVAGGLDALQLGVDFYQTPISSFPDPQKGNLETDYFAQQEVMFPGKLIAMGTAGNQQADMLEQEAKLRELRLIRNLKSTYYGLYEIDRKLDINQQNQELVKQLQEITRKQYELGLGDQSDVLRAQTEYSSLLNTRLILTQTRKSLMAELNALLNRPRDTAGDAIPALQPPKTSLTLAQLIPLAENHQPELKAAQSNIEMSRAEQGASFWGFFSDLMARGTYKDMRGTGENYWSLMVGFTLPITPWSLPKSLSQYQQTSAGVDQAEAHFRQARNQVFAQLQQSLDQVEANEAIVQLNRATLLPQAEQTLQATLAAYQTGKRDFMTLLDAFRTVWMARDNEVMAIKNLLISLAELEQAVGLSMPEIAAALQPKEKIP